MKNNKASNQDWTRINQQIRANKVRLLKGDEKLGILPTTEALRMAREAGMDLVEIAPQADPPVCRILDYGKFRFDEKQKLKDQKKRSKEASKSQKLKELRLRPVIGEHDAGVKSNHARKFLEKGSKVQFNMMFKGRRELVHRDQGFDVIKKMVASLNDISEVESPPKMEGYRLTCRLTPKT